LPTDLVDRFVDDYQETTLTITDWKRQIAESDLESQHKRHVIGYLNWLGTQPQQPSPDVFLDTVVGTMDAYEDSVLPSDAGDEPVSELAETLRGFDRTVTLLETVQQRYSKWLDYGRADRSWAAVADLLDAFATTLPGRRELPTAAAIDVKEANDLWALEVPYVIAVGLVDTEWPRPINSPVPSVSRAAISHQEDPHNSGVRPHSSWTTARYHDHFVSAATAARELFVVTRFATDADGVDQQPSRFLDGLEPTRITEELAEFVADPSMLPKPIAESVQLEVQQ
jgi:ATP-dependent helicase/nuclease subunit B